jgi:hypothetical protein
MDGFFYLDKFSSFFYNSVLSNEKTSKLDKMKKIQISHFKRKYDEKIYEDIRQAILANVYDYSSIKNTSININSIIRNIKDDESKNKFHSWASGYDFAVIDTL